MIRATTPGYQSRMSPAAYVAAHILPGLRAGGDAVAQTVYDRERELCPVDTGALRDSITIETSDGYGMILWWVGPHMFYAPYVEFGTGIAGESSPGAGPGPYSPHWPGMVAQPFVRPALDEIKPQAAGIVTGFMEAA